MTAAARCIGHVGGTARELPKAARQPELLSSTQLQHLCCSGQLPPQDPVFMAPASFGFPFSCEDKGGINPPTGQLRIQLTYRDHGSNPIGSSFSI